MAESSTEELHDRSPSPPVRPRLNSKDIPRTYSGLYGTGGELTHQTPSSDLLPFELSRNLNTDWLKYSPRQSGNGGLHNFTISSLLFTYLFFIALIEIMVLALPLVSISIATSWTYTNVLHGIITLLCFHWIKGSPNWYEQGELNAMTLWEQLNSSPDPSCTLRYSKQMLFVVPTVLCYLACHFGRYEKVLSLVNVFFWIVCLVAKLDWMNGVRLWGINRTIGIDDDLREPRKRD